jgi:hypothetical protein
MNRAAPQLPLNFIVLKRMFMFSTEGFVIRIRSNVFSPSTSIGSPGGPHV